MPNWCGNQIKIIGPREKIRELWRNTEANGLLATMVPEPDYSVTPVRETFPEIKAQHAKTEAEREEAVKNEPAIREDSWWDWRVQNWGTKWDVDSDTLVLWDSDDHDLASIEGGFDSAWSPPEQAVATYCEQNPDVEITLYYYESGMAFAGICHNGFSDDYEVPATAEEVRNQLPRELDEMMGISEFMESWEELDEETA